MDKFQLVIFITIWEQKGRRKMEQNFNDRVEQVAGENIINIYINLKNNDININKITHKQILQTINYVKKQNKKIYKKRYVNFHFIAILFIALIFLSVSALNLHAVTSTETSIIVPFFSGNSLFTIVIVSIFFLPILTRALYGRTKYLHPILVENNKIIYELELEIQRRELRGE